MKASVSAASLYDLTPGTRVVALSPDWLAGHAGVVVDLKLSLLNGHDCAVNFGFRADANPFFMYAHELAVES